MNLRVPLLLLFSSLSLATFYNPILDGKHADPWMIRIGDWYYLTATTGGDVTLWRSRNISNFHGVESKVLWTPSGTNLAAIWAPEIHSIRGGFYVYFAAAANNNNDNHRLYVLQAGSSDPFGNWNFRGQIGSADNNWAIDGTIFQSDKFPGKLFLIWSGWANPNAKRTQNIYIAPMSDPLHVSGPRVLLHTPDQPWMKDGDFGILEGPEILIHNNRIFLIFSASSSWTSRYCLGFMGTDGNDPLNPSTWWRYNDRPIMQTGNGVFGPGHCSFTTDHKGAPWIIYHANEVADGGWAGRTVRAEPFGWNPDGSCALPSPPKNLKQAVQSPA